MADTGKTLCETSLRKLGPPALILALALVAWVVLSPEKPARLVESAATPSVPQARVTPPPPPAIPPPVDHPMLASTSKFQSPTSTADEDLEIVHAVLGNFRRAFEGNPVGENEEIFAALRGQNPKRIRFLPDTFPGLQKDGRVFDRWGTPWRFHALSGLEMDVRSAGPDREFGTTDDLGWGSAP
jgi:hypothetical protein